MEDNLMVAGHEATPHEAEGTRHLKDYWAHGKGAALIQWGTPGDFERCRVELGKYVHGHTLDGLCANLHHEATGAWPGHAPGEQGKH
jgi:hypothetical protein